VKKITLAILAMLLIAFPSKAQDPGGDVRTDTTFLLDLHVGLGTELGEEVYTFNNDQLFFALAAPGLEIPAISDATGFSLEVGSSQGRFVYSAWINNRIRVSPLLTVGADVKYADNADGWKWNYGMRGVIDLDVARVKGHPLHVEFRAGEEDLEGEPNRHISVALMVGLKREKLPQKSLFGKTSGRKKKVKA